MDLKYTNDLVIENGDIAITDNNKETCAAFIIEAGKGNFICSPMIGYHASSKINAEFDQVREQGEMIRELKKDKINLKSLKYDGKTIDISIK